MSTPFLPPKPSRHPLNYRLECPNCFDKAPNFYEDFAAGDLVCTNCGTVVGDRIIDTRSEWRTFSNDGGVTDDPSRVGGPSNPLLGGEGNLDTMISSRGEGNSGTAKELSRLQGRANFSASEKSLVSSFKTISVMCERIGLPKVIADRAKQLFKLVDDDKVFRGKGTDGPIAASLYLACREAKVPRTFKEISSLTLVPKKDIGRCCKAMAPYLEKMTVASTEDFMARFCSYLSLNIEIQKVAINVLQKIKEIGCADGKSPISVASAAIYLVSHLFEGMKKSPKDIAFVSGVSEVTIRNSYKELYPYRTQLVPKELHCNLVNLPIC